MTKKGSPGNAYVTKQTLMTSIVLALMVGFFGGFVFGIYKTSSDLPVTQSAGNAEDAARTRMLQTLETSQWPRVLDLTRRERDGESHHPGGSDDSEWDPAARGSSRAATRGSDGWGTGHVRQLLALSEFSSPY